MDAFFKIFFRSVLSPITKLQTGTVKKEVILQVSKEVEAEVLRRVNRNVGDNLSRKLERAFRR